MRRGDPSAGCSFTLADFVPAPLRAKARREAGQGTSGALVAGSQVSTIPLLLTRWAIHSTRTPRATLRRAPGGPPLTMTVTAGGGGGAGALRECALERKPGKGFGFFLRLESGEEGHLIREVAMGSPAHGAGLQDGDRVIRVNGEHVDGGDHAKVVDLIKKSGDKVTLVVQDAKSYKEQRVAAAATPAKGPSSQGPRPRLCTLQRSSDGFGFHLKSIEGSEGMFIMDVKYGSPAEKAGLRSEDRLVALNGEDITDLTHAIVVDKVKRGGKTVHLLVVDKEASEHFKRTGERVTAAMVERASLPHQPRSVKLKRASDGYGFFLRAERGRIGHFIREIDAKSPADKMGLKDGDRIVAVGGDAVDKLTHEEVVERIRKDGSSTTLLVLSEAADAFYTMHGINPVGSGGRSDVGVSGKAASPADAQDLRPRLRRLSKGADGFGFHLYGIRGQPGQYIKKVTPGSPAALADLHDDDMVVEVNGHNVQEATHADIVAKIRDGGASVELLVASQAAVRHHRQLGTAITRSLAAGGETARDAAAAVAVAAAVAAADADSPGERAVAAAMAAVASVAAARLAVEEDEGDAGMAAAVLAAAAAEAGDDTNDAHERAAAAAIASIAALELAEHDEEESSESEGDDEDKEEEAERQRKEDAAQAAAVASIAAIAAENLMARSGGGSDSEEEEKEEEEVIRAVAVAAAAGVAAEVLARGGDADEARAAGEAVAAVTAAVAEAAKEKSDDEGDSTSEDGDSFL
ncbi:Na(+)/H(+) exchange regulatory cofactor NHE-RF3-like [Petromyzon marinus]|uniref:Na(+)/H(+) exchange regulatory cofactor NHE-RF3-like n=1 Tax=Petromyzon marinus TaxID=7757 RepID=A0AAJ7TLS4_PETMA|nr:Na(+)/H(+) exchange regulatory cofactor NHE-RF3-like [Petromyzon marinus]